MAKQTGHWRARANDYRNLAKTERDLEVRQAVDHLAHVCDDMANAREVNPPKPPVWITASNIPREADAHRWRIRQAEYLAQADHCQSPEAIRGWRTLAGRCAEAAAYLEATQPRADRRRSG
jgi:hypothetical protein